MFSKEQRTFLADELARHARFATRTQRATFLDALADEVASCLSYEDKPRNQDLKDALRSMTNALRAMERAYRSCGPVARIYLDETNVQENEADPSRAHRIDTFNDHVARLRHRVQIAQLMLLLDGPLLPEQYETSRGRPPRIRSGMLAERLVFWAAYLWDTVLGGVPTATANGLGFHGFALALHETILTGGDKKLRLRLSPKLNDRRFLAGMRDYRAFMEDRLLQNEDLLKMQET